MLSSLLRVIVVPPSQTLGRDALVERGAAGPVVLLSSALSPDERSRVLGRISAAESRREAANDRPAQAS